METHSLLTIKEFAELCQVHPKSLRYYDSLGILKPCYVNPQNGYRYYSIYQRDLVGAIQQLVEVGIPVKNFANYISSQKKEIHWGNLMKDAISILEEQIKKEQFLLSKLKGINSDFHFFEELDSDIYTYNASEELPCLAIPFDGVRNTKEWEQALKQLLFTIRQNQLTEGHHTSIIRLKESGSWKQYLCLAIDHLPEYEIEGFKKIALPYGRFLCKITKNSNLDNIWNWIPASINREQIELLFETEARLSTYRYAAPILEQGFLLNEN